MLCRNRSGQRKEPIFHTDISCKTIDTDLLKKSIFISNKRLGVVTSDSRDHVDMEMKQQLINWLVKKTYFSGSCNSGYSSCKICTTSEKCETLSTKQYLPLAEGISNAWTCALATSLTLIHPKLAFGYVRAPASNKQGEETVC